MNKLLIGTNNPSKLQRIRDILYDMPVECISPAQLGLTIDAPENARTAAGNALEKALAWHKASGLPVLTEDSGLILLDLPEDHPDQPGIHVRRVAGYDMTDEEIITWFADVAHRHGGALRAAWMDAWCLLADSTRYLTYAEDREHPSGWVFQLVDTPCSARHSGWPLDSLSVGIGTGKYKAEMTIDDMDVSFMQDASNGFEARKRLQAWIRQGIAEMILQ